MKYFIVSGEPSGDLHGASLARELFNIDNAAEIQGWGGEKMRSAGVKVLKDYAQLAFMGFKEVIGHLPKIFKNFSDCKSQITALKPDVVIFIDYPGFNMRMAKWAKQKGYKTVYYISPQVWAWKAGRAKKLKKTVDKMITILPFEKEFYKKYRYDVEYVGHPLVKVIEDYRKGHPATSTDHIIALLPGSRKQEINRILPIMLEVVNDFPDYEFIVAGAPGQNREFYQSFMKNTRAKLQMGNTYGLLNSAKAALVTSGTATLETALFHIPQVVCYRGSNISYRIAKALIKVKYISIVNLLAGKELVKELIQNELNKENLKVELNKILKDGDTLTKIYSGYRDLTRTLGEGNAAHKAAEIIYYYLD